MVVKNISFWSLLLTCLFTGLVFAKVYKRCELAKELKNVYKIPTDQLGTWVCIAKHESNYDTRLVSRPNKNGSRGHGIFQINDKYWCSPPGKGKGCGLPCAKFEDDKIADDIKCAQTIYKKTKKSKDDGFKAWTVYTRYCEGSKAKKYIKGCF